MARDRMTGLADIRLVVSDIDGTLVRSDKSLSPATVAAVARLQAAGVGFTLISARPPSGLAGLVQALALDAPLGAFNGATIFRPDGAIVEAHRIGEGEAVAALGVLARHGVPAWVFADGVWIAPTRDMAHVRNEIVASGQEPVVAGDPTPWLARADKVMGVCDDPALLARVEADMRAALGTGASIARSQTYYLDVTAPATDKGHGVRELAKAFDVPLEAVAVLGDMPNDLPMFAVAGLAVAMGQSGEEVRGGAHRTTRGNDEDGVAAFLDAVVAARG